MHHDAVHTGAAVALAPGVTVQAGYLRDAAGREYPVDAYGEIVAKSCREGVTTRELAQAMAYLSAAPVAQVEESLFAFVLRLHALRLLSIHQSFAREWARDLAVWPFDAIVMLATRSLAPTRLASRRIYAPAPANVVRAVVEGLTYLTASAVVMALVAVVATDFSIPLTPAFTADRSALLALITTVVALLILASAIVHELGHLLVARLLGVPVVGVQVRRGAASVLLAPGPKDRMQAVIVAGPFAGATFAAICGALLLGLFEPGWQLAAIDNVRLSIGCVTLVIAAWHLFSLLPIFGDGRALRAGGVDRR
jgi:hypothetical protein